MGKNTRIAQDISQSKQDSLLARLRARSVDIAKLAAAPPKPAIDDLFPYRHLFLRDPSAFVPRTKSKDRDRQVIEIVRHAFGSYPVNKTLTSSWTRPAQGSTLKVDFRLWHVCAATGGSLYKQHAKPHLSKMEAHLFLRCPHDIAIEQALCHCVCLAAGASDGVALRLARSKIHEKPFNDFWRQALRFLSKHVPPSIDAANDLCDYIEQRQLDGSEHILAGQSLASLQNRMRDWHRDLQRARILGDAIWPGRDQPNDSFERRDADGKPIFWDFTQINSAKELAAECSQMRHCVLSYKRRCIDGALSIWSLSRREHFGYSTKKLTIELRSDGMIAQARGLANRPPRPEEVMALKSWAQARRLHTNLF